MTTQHDAVIVVATLQAQVAGQPAPEPAAAPIQPDDYQGGGGAIVWALVLGPALVIGLFGTPGFGLRLLTTHSPVDAAAALLCAAIGGLGWAGADRLARRGVAR